mgnify:CR=1 FL=1
MAERRRATRREPIEVEVEDGRVFVARPLPWMFANDLGDSIIQQNADAVNHTVRLYMDGDIPQLEASLGVKIKDWQALLKLAYPDDIDSFTEKPLDRTDCAELILAALEVNHLDHLKPLVDPNSPSPTTTGGNDSSALAGTLLGQKTESTPSSSSEDSEERTSSPSPVESSSTS